MRLLRWLFFLLPVWCRDGDGGDPEQPSTVIDVLSSQVEFSLFLRLLQRSMLIPYLNQLQNFTLAAPVNSAFAAMACGSDSCMQNQLMTLADLGKYIISEPVNLLALDGTHIYHILSTSKQTSPTPVKVSVHEDKVKINNVDVVEQDLYAQHQNAYVQGVDKLFKELKPVDEVLKTIPDTLVFNSLVSDNLNLTGKTLFVPIDASFQLEDHQLNYLVTNYGISDRKSTVNSLVVEGLYGGDVNETLSDLNGNELSLISTDKGSRIKVNGTFVSLRSNILAHDSIIHVFDSKELIPRIEFNVLKTLVGLDASAFVDELILQELTDLITNNSLEQTIFYPRDSAVFSIASKSSNLYHFVNERIANLTLTKSLYDTRFCNSKKLGTSCQKIKARRVGNNNVMLNNNVLVESGPYIVGNTTIYLTDDDLRTPNEMAASVNSVLHCSISIGLLDDFGLSKLSNNHAGYTLFLPCFDSWDDYHLTLNYLKENTTALEHIMKNMILNGLVYTDFQDRATLTNLNDEAVDIQYAGREESLLKLKFNDVELSLKGDNDIIFNQGVIHPIEQMLIPDDIDISLSDIITHSDAELLLDMMKFFPDLNDILNNDSYSFLLPSTASLLRMSPIDSNETLKEFLHTHIIPPHAIDDLYTCADEIATLNERANLTCTLVGGHSFLQIARGSEDNSVRVLSKGCTSTTKRSCVYAIDKPISLKWIGDQEGHLHISLPAIAVGLGMILGSVIMATILACLVLVLFRKTKKIDSSRAVVDERTPLVDGETNDGVQAGAQVGANGGTQYNSFESGYSVNANVEPIAFQRNRQGDV